MTDAHHVAVIGGGASGLGATATLAEHSEDSSEPLRCTVFEASDSLGGVMQTTRFGDYTIEQGPGSVFANSSFQSLCELVGLDDELIEPENTPESPTCLLHHGEIVPLPDGFVMGIPTDREAIENTSLLSRAGKRRVLEEPSIPPVQPDGDMALGSFLRKRLGDELVDVVLEPLLAGPYAGDIDELSLKALYPQLLNVEREYGNLMEGMKKRSGPRGHGKTESPRVVSFPDGMAQLVEGLEKWLAERIQVEKNTRIERIKTTAEEHYKLEPQKGPTIKADSVLLAVPAHQAASLLESDVPQAAEIAETIDYTSVTIAAFVFDTEELEIAFDGRTLLVPRENDRLTTTYTFESNGWPSRCPENETLIRCHLGRQGLEPSEDASDEELKKRALRELHSLFDLESDLEPKVSRVFPWRRSMPQYSVGHQNRVEQLRDELEAYPGLAVAGSAYDGIGVPSCISQGQHTADQLLS